MNLKDSYHPYAITTIIFWALAFAFTKLALEVFSPFSLGFLRYFIASIAMIIIVIKLKLKFPEKKDIPLFIASGGSGFFMYMITFNKGAGMASAATASVIIALAPVITAVFASLIYKEKLSGIKWGGIAIQFLGVAVLTILNSVFSMNSGLIWLFGAALSLSAYNLVQRKLTKKYTALETAAYSIFAGTILLAIFSPAAIKESANASAMHYIYVAILGIFSSAVAYLTWSKAFAKAEQTSMVSNYMFLTPFLTSVFSFLIIGEVPDRYTLIGGIIILFGIFVFNFGEKMLKKGVK